MIDPKDEEWLKKALEECFDGVNDKANKKLLEGFSMLARNMVKNIEKSLNEIKTLWERDPASKELREKFDSLAKYLFYFERYCREKIGRELPNQ